MVERKVAEVEDFTTEGSDDNALHRNVFSAQDAVAVGKVGFCPEVFVHCKLLLDDGKIQDSVEAYHEEVAFLRIAHEAVPAFVHEFETVGLHGVGSGAEGIVSPIRDGDELVCLHSCDVSAESV